MVVLVAGDPAVPEPDVVLVVQQLLPVRPHIEGDGECLAGRDAGDGGVEGELAHGDTHALGPQVAQAQDPLTVRNHDTPHVMLRPVLQHLVHVARVVDRDEQALHSGGDDDDDDDDGDDDDDDDDNDV